MATITFKTKVQANGLFIVPVFKQSHVDMPAFRAHLVYGAIANSDLLLNALARIRRDIIGSATRDYMWLDKLPANVSVNRAGFLASVTITV